MTLATLIKEYFPLAFSAIAIYIAARANRIAMDAAEGSKRHQERTEVYQFYPMMWFSANVRDDKLLLQARNNSEINASSEIEVDYTVRAWAANVHNLDKQGTIRLPKIRPGELYETAPEEIGKYIAMSRLFLGEGDPMTSRMVVRLFFKYRSSHPESELKGHELVLRYTYGAEGLIVLDPSKA